MPTRAYSQPLGKPGSLLFGTTNKTRNSFPSPSGSPSKSPLSAPNWSPPHGLSTASYQTGYLAFPTGLNPAAVILESDRSDLQKQQAAERDAEQAARERRQREEAEAAAWQAEQERMKKLHEERLAREAEEARKGEEYWVSCGGVLRDEHGRRDLERTQAIREELQLREVEKRLTERWERYERQWRELVAKTKAKRTDDASGTDSELDTLAMEGSLSLTFADIPWPIDVNALENKGITLEDLSFARIEEFLLGNLRVRGCKITKKERVRSSLLRWHPDKLTAIVARIDPQEKEEVLHGINSVMRSLHRLNSKV